MANQKKSSGGGILKFLLMLAMLYVVFKVAKYAFGYVMVGWALASIGLWGFLYFGFGIGVFLLMGFIVMKMLGGGKKKKK